MKKNLQDFFYTKKSLFPSNQIQNRIIFGSPIRKSYVRWASKAGPRDQKFQNFAAITNLFPARCSYELALVVRALFVRARVAFGTLLARCSYAARTSANSPANYELRGAPVWPYVKMDWSALSMLGIDGVAPVAGSFELGQPAVPPQHVPTGAGSLSAKIERS